MDVSLADSRTKGFKKWADVHQPEKLGGARAGAGEDVASSRPRILLKG
jgi:hypothetical protein